MYFSVHCWPLGPRRARCNNGVTGGGYGRRGGRDTVTGASAHAPLRARDVRRRASVYRVPSRGTAGRVDGYDENVCACTCACVRAFAGVCQQIAGARVVVPRAAALKTRCTRRRRRRPGAETTKTDGAYGFGRDGRVGGAAGSDKRRTVAGRACAGLAPVGSPGENWRRVPSLHTVTARQHRQQQQDHHSVVSSQPAIVPAAAAVVTARAYRALVWKCAPKTFRRDGQLVRAAPAVNAVNAVSGSVRCPDPRAFSPTTNRVWTHGARDRPDKRPAPHRSASAR